MVSALTLLAPAQAPGGSTSWSTPYSASAVRKSPGSNACDGARRRCARSRRRREQRAVRGRERGQPVDVGTRHHPTTSCRPFADLAHDHEPGRTPRSSLGPSEAGRSRAHRRGAAGAHRELDRRHQNRRCAGQVRARKHALGAEQGRNVARRRADGDRLAPLGYRITRWGPTGGGKSNVPRSTLPEAGRHAPSRYSTAPLPMILRRGAHRASAHPEPADGVRDDDLVRASRSRRRSAPRSCRQARSRSPSPGPRSRPRSRRARTRRTRAR